uniref:Uncharacterized protein n=1 Tax=Arundo donax TaxID=35708 RepID=A0A0A9DPZ8_ARUDO
MILQPNKKIERRGKEKEIFLLLLDGMRAVTHIILKESSLIDNKTTPFSLHCLKNIQRILACSISSLIYIVK